MYKIKNLLIIVTCLVLFVSNSYADVILNSSFMYRAFRWSDGSYEYTPELEIYGRLVEQSNRLKFKTPTNTYGLMPFIDYRSVSFFERFDTYDELLSEYPAGNYRIIQNQAGLKRSIVRFISDEPQFPPFPVVTYPEDQQLDVGLTPTISWEPVPDGNNWIWIFDDSRNPIYNNNEIPEGETSFDVPEGMLEPNKWYEVEIGVNIEGLNGNSAYCVRFYTGSS
jgi:hypothetical protein